MLTADLHWARSKDYHCKIYSSLVQLHCVQTIAVETVLLVTDYDESSDFNQLR